MEIRMRKGERIYSSLLSLSMLVEIIHATTSHLFLELTPTIFWTRDYWVLWMLVCNIVKWWPWGRGGREAMIIGWRSGEVVAMGKWWARKIGERVAPTGSGCRICLVISIPK